MISQQKSTVGSVPPLPPPIPVTQETNPRVVLSIFTLNIPTPTITYQMFKVSPVCPPFCFLTIFPLVRTTPPTSCLYYQNTLPAWSPSLSSLSPQPHFCCPKYLCQTVTYSMSLSCLKILPKSSLLVKIRTQPCLCHSVSQDLYLLHCLGE